jgi:hypothetical protein
LRPEKVVTGRSLSEKFNQEPKTSQGRTKMNAEKNFGNEESAMKTKNGQTHNVSREDDRTSITPSSTTVLR